MKFKPDRIDSAKLKLRKVLSFENIKSKEKYKDMTKQEYDEFIEKLETLSFLIVESYFHQSSDELP